jgi:hypothetical protein
MNKILEYLRTCSMEAVDRVSNRVGLSSIALSVTATGAEAVEKAAPVVADEVLFSLSASDIALLVSTVGGVLFIIEKVIVIYLRVKRARLLDDD